MRGYINYWKTRKDESHHQKQCYDLYSFPIFGIAIDSFDYWVELTVYGIPITLRTDKGENKGEGPRVSLSLAYNLHNWMDIYMLL